MKTRVRPFTSGLVRIRRATIRAALVLVAAVSISGFLLGPSAAAAVASRADGPVAADTGRDVCSHDGPSPAADHHADGEWHSDDHSRRGTCTPSPLPRVHTPAPPPVQGPPPAATPVQVSTSSVSPSRPIVSVRRPALLTPRVPELPIAQRPPLLAPPALTVPSPGVAGAVSTSPVSIYVITLSTLMVATAIAIAALILVRRSD